MKPEERKRPGRKPNSGNLDSHGNIPNNKYDPKYCKMIVDFARNNIYLTASWAERIGVTKPTIVNWTKKYPEFKEAYDMAFDIVEAKLIKAGIDKATGLDPKADATMVKFWLGSSFNYREKDLRDDVKDEVQKQLPTFINNDEELNNNED